MDDERVPNGGSARSYFEVCQPRRPGWCGGWVLEGLAAGQEGSVEQTVEALSRDVARLRRQLIERQAS